MHEHSTCALTMQSPSALAALPHVVVVAGCSMHCVMNPPSAPSLYELNTPDCTGRRPQAGAGWRSSKKADGG